MTQRTTSSPSAGKRLPHAKAHQLSVAPMMDWTDRHCRYFHRLLAPEAALYTEMVTADAIRHGDRDRLLDGHHLDHDKSSDNAIILQLGSANPDALAEAVTMAESYAYAEYNLNVGCPSDRVQSGRFGAALMADPVLVGELVSAMRSATKRPVSVKCRLGIDDMDIEETLDRFIDAIIRGGVDHIIIHARKAWLKGLSPKENRDIPPLDYDRVYALKKQLSDAGTHIPVSINGGITDWNQIRSGLDHVDGVMIGRAAYQQPAKLANWAGLVFDHEPADADTVMQQMADYADAEIAKGARLISITRHMLGFANGRKGAKRWRRTLSEDARDPASHGDLIRIAWDILNRECKEAA
ncbi:MAG: tRNA dihydrouridine(20/20a) synthase DusA [Candidatus Puniceispirillales bacterium]